MKISIITVCYNCEKTIEDTIKSVLNQTYTDFEYIVVDGLSKDNTKNIISNYLTDNRIKFICEKDNGLYDAMNKGIKMATGDIIGIINADDVLFDENVFKTIVDNFDKDTDITYGDILYMDEKLENVVRNYISGIPSGLAFCPAHPSMYVRKDIYDKLGTYNTRYRICADFDFMVRCNKNKVKYKYIKQYLVKMRYGGTSNGLLGYVNNFKECLILLKENNIPFPLLITTKKTLKTIFQLIKK